MIDFENARIDEIPNVGSPGAIEHAQSSIAPACRSTPVVATDVRGKLRLTRGQWGLEWRTDGARHTLHRGNGATVLAALEPDAVYPGMWRISFPDGSLSDLTNLTRAKDAAENLALAALNHRGAQ